MLLYYRRLWHSVCFNPKWKNPRCRFHITFPQSIPSWTERPCPAALFICSRPVKERWLGRQCPNHSSKTGNFLNYLIFRNLIHWFSLVDQANVSRIWTSYLSLEKMIWIYFKSNMPTFEAKISPFEFSGWCLLCSLSPTTGCSSKWTQQYRPHSKRNCHKTWPESLPKVPARLWKRSNLILCLYIGSTFYLSKRLFKHIELKTKQMYRAHAHTNIHTHSHSDIP